MNILLSLFSQFGVELSLLFEHFMFRAKPVLLGVQAVALPLVGCLSGIMGVQSLLELPLSATPIDFQLSDAGLHLRHLPFFFSFEEFGLELATGTLVLDLIDQRLDLL